MPMVPAKGRGRPTKLTPEKAKTFIDYMEAGVQRKDAAAMIGVNASTIYAWVTAGVRAVEQADKDNVEVSPEDQPMVDFSNAYAQARAEYSIGLLTVATSCAKAGEGKMLQFLMKADKPDVYGDRPAIAVAVSTNVVTMYTTSETLSTTLQIPEGDG